MRVNSFDFDLPSDRIATRPAEPRDAARLLVVGPGSNLRHHTFRELPEFLSEGDILVVNDTRVIPSRMIGEIAGTRVEVTFVNHEGGSLWSVLARPARKLKPRVVITFAGNLAAEVVLRDETGRTILDIGAKKDEFFAHLQRHGFMPLPPYLGRNADTADRHDYQTVFARHSGAVAAPTAGLHFTDGLLETLATAGIERTSLTLHVGPGTFLPVRSENTDDHVMHAEWGEITKDSADRINAARASGGRIVAVGTTSVRLLESAADGAGLIHPFSGDTSLFIMPGYGFRSIDAVVTNFHLPRSTLFMLVCAFSGTDTMKRAYREAVERHYRFYSYGDACLLIP